MIGAGVVHVGPIEEAILTMPTFAGDEGRLVLPGGTCTTAEDPMLGS
jgi:hypothetical protein